MRIAEAGTDTEPGKPFREVLEQFVNTLRKLGIGARLDPLADPRKLGVWLYPEHRPSRGSIMLTFFFEGDAIIASGDSPTRLGEPELLEAWLVEFVKKSAFIESLAVLREEARQPVEAQLRVNADGRGHAQDVIVTVSACDQEALDALTIGAQASLDVERAEFPGNPQLMAQPAYALLDSAGLVVRVVSSTLNGAKLTIQGTRVA
ncbi:hypothetical protein WMF45_18120 [Sorangium sp. So ce448]|uniref:hypothetical protein n=1 Tax=Sorangium sp. So ce448 TaxID=3133314 RepID=UPI003F61F0D5